jgi:hypothetical protein
MNEATREKTAGFAALKRDLDRLLDTLADYAAQRGSHACEDGAHGHGHGHHHHHGHGHDDGHSHDHEHHDHDHRHDH